jgi:hypothetical protein
MSEINQALTAWNKGDYFAFGTALGEALDAVFLKASSSST